MNALPLLMMLVIAGAFWLLVLRPAKARQQTQSSLVEKIAVGDNVMTTAGLFGQVTAVDGDEITLSIAPGVEVRYLKVAIAKIEDSIEEVVTQSAGDETIVISSTEESNSNSRLQ